MYKKQNGFGVVEVILILVVIGIIGFTGWRVYEANKEVENLSSETKTSTTSNGSSSDENSLYIVDNVSFEMPKGWFVDNDNVKPFFKNLVKGVAIIPGEKLRTIYGDGSEYFHVYFSVYTNASNIPPKDWFSSSQQGEGLSQGVAFENDKEVTDPV
jgi:hypothetical protein